MKTVQFSAGFLVALTIFTKIVFVSSAVSVNADYSIVNPPFLNTYPQTFTLENQQFLLNGQPLYVAAGEIHYSRIPSEYWRTRIQTIKALGLNALSVYIMWNFHEIAPGQFDFESADKNLRNFLQIAKEEEMYVLIRPGPYVCAEWDFGGQPFWLLKQNMELRSTDPKYLAAITPYINKVAEVFDDYQITKNGTILMVQVENEFGSYGSNNAYPLKLQEIWEATNRITVPYYTADGGSVIQIGHVPGAAIGLNPGTEEKYYTAAHQLEKNMPVMSSETYPGWLTHWGENWATVGTQSAVSQFENLVKNKHSFSMYMVYGGTNFGLTAGSNNNNDDTAFQPDITSYDYDAPINEQGAPTDKFIALRNMFANYFKWTIPDVPTTIAPVITVDAFTPHRVGSLWNIYRQTPKINFDQPQTFESFNQNQGIVAYSFDIRISKTGAQTLSFDKIRDYSHVTVQINGNISYKGTINRLKNENSFTFTHNAQIPVLATVTIFVEAFGHTNYGHQLFDSKGIVGKIQFNKQTVSSIDHALIPLDNIPSNITSLRDDSAYTEQFYQGSFDINGQIGDTYLNVSQWTKGYVWVNGVNLGRYWNIGPQMKLFCPATILKQTNNQVVVFDLEQNNAASIQGELTLY